MQPEEIHLTDWVRILIGEVPNDYFIELIIRIAFVYLLLSIAMRLMGKRMASQLSRNELAALVSLAAAIGIPILAPERGLLPAVVIALVIVFTQRLIAWLAYRNQRFEEFSQGDISILAEDAVLKLPAMESTRITRERLMAQLRQSGLLHLGQVKRLYIESSGSFTLVQDEQPKPGLTVLPDWDTDFLNAQKKVPGQFVCTNCGNPKQVPTAPVGPCDNCGNKRWQPAVEV